MPSTNSAFKDVQLLSENTIEELFNHIGKLISFNLI